MTFLDELRAKAVIWRSRPPSGRYVLHWLPRKSWCPMHGQVTRYHFCKVNCAVAGFKCLPGCSREACEGPGVAT